MKFLLYGLMVILSNLCFAQDIDQLYAETNLTNFSLCNQSVWQSISNPAGFSNDNKKHFGFFIKNHFLINDFSTQLIAATIPLKKSICLNAAFFRFGNNYFSKNELSSSVSLILSEKISAGTQLHLLYIHQSEERNHWNALPTVGITYKLTSNFLLSSSLKTYITSGSSSKNQILRIGCSYLFNKKLRTHFQCLFSNEKYPLLAIALDYKLQDNIAFKINVSSSNQPFHFGLTYAFKSILIGIDFGYHQQLGFSPSSSIEI